MARNNKDRILVNSSEYYKPLRKSRNLKLIQHFETPRLYHPTVEDRRNVITEAYLWSYGDRYYKLAHDYYSDSNLWWIIAWFNGYPTEAEIENGSIIEIPIDLEQVSRVLGV